MMNVTKLIKKLQAIKAEGGGNLPVMYQDGDGDSVWSLDIVKVHVAEKGEYPKDWKMPGGFKFVKLDTGY